jgi:hypothetical protein
MTTVIFTTPRRRPIPQRNDLRELLQVVGGLTVVVGLVGLATSIASGFTIIVIGALMLWAAAMILPRPVGF